MAEEEDFRRLQAEMEGVDPARELTFLGETYLLRDDGGLPALLRYVTRARADEAAEAQTRTMAAVYQVLSECVHPDYWPSFQAAAMAGKAGQAEIKGAVDRVAEILTARPACAGIRLLSYAASSSLGEIDGHLLLTTGQGLAGRTARQACNIIYARVLASIEDEDRRAEFTEDLNSPADPETDALQQALAMIEEKKKQAEADGGDSVG